MKRATAKRLLILSVVAALTVGSLSTSALAAGARTAKAEVADDIEALASSGDKRLDARIERAARIVRSGLDGSLWDDDNTPASPVTFRTDGRAVRDLNGVIREAAQLAGDAHSLQARLAAVDHQIAAARILAAAAAGADEDVLARAQRLIDRGNIAASRDRYDRAIRSYLRAWRMATRAMETATDPANPPGG